MKIIFRYFFKRMYRIRLNKIAKLKIDQIEDKGIKIYTNIEKIRFEIYMSRKICSTSDICFDET